MILFGIGVLMLKLGGSVSRSQWVQSFLWTNGKLGEPKLAPGLDEEVWRFTVRGLLQLCVALCRENLLMKCRSAKCHPAS